MHADIDERAAAGHRFGGEPSAEAGNSPPSIPRCMHRVDVSAPTGFDELLQRLHSPLKRLIMPICTVLPLFFAADTIASASARLIAIGFSRNTCLPARATRSPARRAGCSACR